LGELLRLLYYFYIFSIDSKGILIGWLYVIRLFHIQYIFNINIIMRVPYNMCTEFFFSSLQFYYFLLIAH
jgi:hypothetical protein